MVAHFPSFPKKNGKCAKEETAARSFRPENWRPSADGMKLAPFGRSDSHSVRALRAANSHPCGAGLHSNGRGAAPALAGLFSGGTAADTFQFIGFTLRGCRREGKLVRTFCTEADARDCRTREYPASRQFLPSAHTAPYEEKGFFVRGRIFDERFVGGREMKKASAGMLFFMRCPDGPGDILRRVCVRQRGRAPSLRRGRRRRRESMRGRRRKGAGRA